MRAFLKCGLLGNKLSHSYSPEMHAMLGDYEYNLFEVSENELDSFMKRADFDGINVTHPYKKSVIKYLDTLSDTAVRIGAVNTVVNDGGRLCGYNTDFFGFSFMLDSADISLRDEVVVILGSGGASLTVQCIAHDRGAREVIVVSRTGADNYENISRHANASVLVNATPVGMYPGNYISPVDITVFPHLKHVVDLVYNPMRTRLITDADELGIHTAGGLTMLAAQAKMSSELFTGQKTDNAVISDIAERTADKMRNIVLIGMPGCGKSTAGRVLASRLGRHFIDTDTEISTKCGIEIPEIFEKYGEEFFRHTESGIIADVSKLSSCVISTGGGAVLRDENVRCMRQNGVLVFLTKEPHLLATSGRPLSQSSDIGDMYKTRLPLYTAAADISVEVSEDAAQTAERIIESVKI